jgi:hypothetical protein
MNRNNIAFPDEMNRLPVISGVFLCFQDTIGWRHFGKLQGNCRRFFVVFAVKFNFKEE